MSIIASDNLYSDTKKSRNITYSGPGVYAAWLGNQPLYVGHSSNINRRLRVLPRTELGRCEAFLAADRVEIYPCNSLRQAQHLEIELIGLYHPRYNISGSQQASLTIHRLKIEHNKLFGEAA